jgi:hypothetical protein
VGWRLWASDIKNEGAIGALGIGRRKYGEPRGRKLTILGTELDSKRLIEMVSALGCS